MSEKDGQPFLLLVEDLVMEGGVSTSSTESDSPLLAQAQALAERLAFQIRSGALASDGAGADAHAANSSRPSTDERGSASRTVSVRSVRDARSLGVRPAGSRRSIPAKAPGASRASASCGVALGGGRRHLAAGCGRQQQEK